MAPGSVDDQYTGCRHKAFEKFIKGGYLNEELKVNSDFSKAWSTGTQYPCLKQNNKTSEEHLRALIAHDREDEMPINNFNEAIMTLGADAKLYEDQFHFKSLHFLLMDSMRKMQPKDCRTVYAILPYRHEAPKGSNVRLGQFLKAYANFNYLKKMTDLNDSFIIKITSCFFAQMGADICSEEDAVLLSPAEVFTVEDRRKVSDQDEESTYEEMTLKHHKLYSYHNCYIFSR